MFAVAEMGESFSEVIREESIIEIEEDLLCVPSGSDQGIHALQGMLVNSISFENATKHHSSDLNQSLRALTEAGQRMADLLGDDTNDVRAVTENSEMQDRAYRPAPFLDQGMLSYYMHADDIQEGAETIPMPELIQQEDLSLVPGISLH